MAAAPALHYRITPADLHAHLYAVELTMAAPAAAQELALPAWIPGSYLVREFAKNLQHLRAVQGGQALAVAQLGKDHWRVDCASGQPLTLHYQVCAYDASVRTAWLDSQRGFFNATSLCLRVLGQDDAPCEVTLDAPEIIAGSAHWHCATALFPLETDAQGFGRYRAQDYDHLADCPVELGPFASTTFDACGTPHRFVLAGSTATTDLAQLATDSRRICEAAIRLWQPAGAPPLAQYLFLLHATHDGYGGLEHRDSTALICKRSDLPRQGDTKASEGYVQLLGLISHEYFHSWCVKRLRPAEFAPYDYQRENYTALLWFFEGFTSYYDDLLLRRAGLIDDASYLKLLTKAINQLLQTPGRQVQTVAQASFDAWVKYYRQDENTPNATVSYYTKGALVALCLDLALRREGRSTLDAVLRTLWQRCQGGPMQEADLLAALEQCSGRSWAAEIAAWVHSTTELPLAELLASQGVQWHDEPAQPAQRLGLRVQEGSTIIIKTVLRTSAAEAAGFMAGDEWLGLEAAGQAWRLYQLGDLALYAAPGSSTTALVARNGRLLRLPLQLPPAQPQGDSVRLELPASNSERARSWLQGA